MWRLFVFSHLIVLRTTTLVLTTLSSPRLHSFCCTHPPLPFCRQLASRAQNGTEIFIEKILLDASTSTKAGFYLSCVLSCGFPPALTRTARPGLSQVRNGVLGRKTLRVLSPNSFATTHCLYNQISLAGKYI